MPARYQKNDPATGKIRWLGKLKRAEVEQFTHNVGTFRFRSLDGGEIPFNYLPGQFLTLDIAPARHPNEALVHDRVDTHLARPYRNHGQTRALWPSVRLVA